LSSFKLSYFWGSLQHQSTYKLKSLKVQVKEVLSLFLVYYSFACALAARLRLILLVIFFSLNNCVIKNEMLKVIQSQYSYSNAQLIKGGIINSHSRNKISLILSGFKLKPTMSRIIMAARKPPIILNPYTKNKSGIVNRLKNRTTVQSSFSEPSSPISLKNIRLKYVVT